MKQYLPKNRNWTQTNDNEGTVNASFGIDFKNHRGHAQAAKPTVKIFDQTDSLSGGGNAFDRYASVILKNLYNSAEAYWVVSRKLFLSAQTDSDLLDKSFWSNDGQSNTPTTDKNTDAVEFNSGMLVLDGDDIARYNGTAWTASWWQGTLGGSSGANFLFCIVGANGRLYLGTDTNKVYYVTTSGTKATTGDGTLDFSAQDITFTCVAKDSTRLHIGFKNNSNNRGGIIEWDMSANSPTANRVHEMGSYPLCIATWDNVVIPVMQNGRFKYFNGTKYVDYTGMQLPEISGVYGDFIHKNGWAIIDDLPHFLIKGTQSLETNYITGDNSFDKNTRVSSGFPSAIYCLDPKVGLYPRFLLSDNKLSTTNGYSTPSVHAVGALFALETEYTKFLASYEVYTENTANNTKAVVAYYDRTTGIPSRSWLLFDSVEKTDVTKNVEFVHRVLGTGSSLKVYAQEQLGDEQHASGAWTTQTEFNTTDSLSGIDDKWVAWIKTGNGSGQFLRVKDVTGGTTKVVQFKDANTFTSFNDQGSMTFMKFRWIGDADKTTVDYHKFALPSGEKNRKVKILVELVQAAGTVTELDYGIIET